MTKRYYHYTTYKEAMDAVYNHGSLSNIHPEVQTPRMVEVAVKDWPYDFIFVRKDLITPKLIMIAVKKWGSNLQFVPAHLQTQKVIEAALKQDSSTKQFIKVKGNK